MAKDSRKNSATSQRSKRSPKQERSLNPPLPEIVRLDLDDPDERSKLEAPGWHRQRKERYFLRYIDEADRVKMADRKWFRVAEIADALSTLTGTIIPDAAKREGALTFVQREILRGEFTDQKGRSQIANLDPSPLVPVRLNTKGMKLEDICKISDRLWIIRQSCFDWFVRKKCPVPGDWVPSGSDAQNRKPVQARPIGTKAAAERIVRDYIEQAKAKGDRPTQVGLIKAARDDGYKGGRDLLRVAIKEQIGVERGRPKK